MNRLLIIIFSLTSLICTGQRLKVASFEIQPKDISARTQPRADNSGQLCALLKVYVLDKITEVQGNVMGEIVDKGVEKWIYVSDHTKQIKLNFENHFPLMLTFSDYDYPAVSEQMVYVIELEDDTAAPSSPKVAEKSPAPSSPTPPARTTPTSEPGNTVASQPAPPSLTEPSLSPEAAETLEMAKKAYKEKDYDKAFWLFMKINVTPEARTYLGDMYYYGHSVSQNRQEAYRLYTLAAEQGSAQAKTRLAGMLLYGEGKVVKADKKRALKLYHEAAEEGILYAQFNLGWMYASGTNVKKNIDEAVKWYRLAAAHTPSSALSEQAKDNLKALGY